MSYGHLIRRPFDIVARRPYLWLLGFLAGGATGFNLPSSGTNYGHPTTSGSYKGPSWTVLQNVWNANWEWVVGILACVVVLGFVLFVLSCIATGGIIRAAVEHDMDREYKLGTAWRAGYVTGWRIAGLKLLTFLLAIVPGFLIGALVLGAVVGAMSSAAAAVGFGLLAAVAILVSTAFWLALGVAFQFAQRLVVLEDGHVAQSLSTGFRLIRWHFKEVAFGWLILIALSIAVGIAFAILAVVVAIPAAALGFGGWAMGGMTGAIVAGSFAAVFLLGILLVAAGAYSAYSSVYWTLLFRNVRGLPAPAARGAIAPAA
ncbi:MAG: hypothetical protein AUJ02_01220 [Chloroflexi bacterium 13_1_40CM_3_65_12]|nr:MAG: hypothetical protein AUH40_09800 [Chloroflexi bacterium 13_1_40CM_65_17]OLC64323.1 MAG: hypothetical protein AUH69_12510 [Actinobacteria bacterium 13_1_40CM_4_65_12]OLD26875.1 MAG: hypothetical protein AUJ02_01220 [Chloroflexi bacterium 13_1_40CM_3_65_12]